MADTIVEEFFAVLGPGAEEPIGLGDPRFEAGVRDPIRAERRSLGG
jgi:hypothetical protein